MFPDTRRSPTSKAFMYMYPTPYWPRKEHFPGTATTDFTRLRYSSNHNPTSGTEHWCNVHSSQKATGTANFTLPCTVQGPSRRGAAGWMQEGIKHQDQLRLLRMKPSTLHNLHVCMQSKSLLWFEHRKGRIRNCFTVWSSPSGTTRIPGCHRRQILMQVRTYTIQNK